MPRASSVAGLDGFEIRIERRLHVHDEIARLGHVHDHVRPQRAVFAEEVQLLGEVAVLGHAGELDDPPQRHLAPAAAHFRPAQRRDEIARLALQLRVTARQPFDLRAQRREGIATLVLQRAHLRFGLLQRGLQRLDELRDGGLAFLAARLAQRPDRGSSDSRASCRNISLFARRVSPASESKAARSRDFGLLEQRRALAGLRALRLAPNALAFERQLQRVLRRGSRAGRERRSRAAAPTASAMTAMTMTSTRSSCARARSRALEMHEVVDGRIAREPALSVNGLKSSPARSRRLRPAARPQRASSAGWISRSYSCVPRGISFITYSAPTIASRNDFRLRLIVEMNTEPPGRTSRASVRHRDIGLRHVLEHLHAGDHVERAGLAGGERFRVRDPIVDGERLLGRVQLRHFDHAFREIDARDLRARAHQRFAEQAAAAAHIQHARVRAASRAPRRSARAPG